MSSIRFAVVGFGHIGRRHAAIVGAAAGARLVAVCDAVPRNDLQWPEGLNPGLPFYQRLDEMLADVEIDVVCICTPNGFHAEQAMDCLAASRHVVIEKPLALTVAECDAVIAAAETYDRHVFGVMQNRYSPASTWLKRVVEGGRLGRLLQVHIDCFWNRDARYYHTPEGKTHPWHGNPCLDGGVLYTQFAHFLDLLCWSFGPVRVIHAVAANQTHHDLHPFADGGAAQFRLEGGGIGSLNFSTSVWDRNFESTLTVIGSRGTVKLAGQYMNELSYCHVKGLDPPSLPPASAPNDYGGYRGSAANHHFVIDNVIDVLNGRAEVATTAREGREVVALIEDIYAAARS